MLDDGAIQHCLLAKRKARRHIGIIWRMSAICLGLPPYRYIYIRFFKLNVPNNGHISSFAPTGQYWSASSYIGSVAGANRFNRTVQLTFTNDSGQREKGKMWASKQCKPTSTDVICQVARQHYHYLGRERKREQESKRNNLSAPLESTSQPIRWPRQSGQWSTTHSIDRVLRQKLCVRAIVFNAFQTKP